jgi:hypothetical protein
MYIGEIEALNDTHERWCRSKEPITLSPLKLNRKYFISGAKINSFVKNSLPAEKLANTCVNSHMYMLIARVDGTAPEFQGFTINYTTATMAMTYACL